MAEPNTQITKPKPKRMPGKFIILPVILILFATCMLPISIQLSLEDWLKCWDIPYIGNELLKYRENNDQQFPPADKWCDTLLEKDEHYFHLQIYKDRKNEFPYTLNIHVYDQNEIPDDMIVLFTAQPGWNQTGDEAYIKERDRITVFTAEGYARTYRKNQIPYLKWTPSNTGIIPAPKTSIPFILLSSLLAIIFITFFVTCRKSLKTFWPLVLVIAIISTAAGVLLGSIAEDDYYRLSAPRDPHALYLAAACCFFIGAAYITILGRIYKKYQPNVSMLGYATTIGAITGLFASTVTHAYLMITYAEPDFSYMLAASSFGIFTGIILGLITAFLITFYKKNPKLTQ